MKEALELVHNGVSSPRTEDRMLNEHGSSDISSRSKTSSDTRIWNCPTNPRATTLVKDGTELGTPSASIRMTQLVGSVTNRAAAVEGSDRASESPPSQLNLKQKHPNEKITVKDPNPSSTPASSSKLSEDLKRQGCSIATLESVSC